MNIEIAEKTHFYNVMNGEVCIIELEDKTKAVVMRTEIITTDINNYNAVLVTNGTLWWVEPNTEVIIPRKANLTIEI